MHDVRIAYFVLTENGQKIEKIEERAFLEGGGCPITGARASAGKSKCPAVKFGWMFGARVGFPPDLKDKSIAAELLKTADSLIELGMCMDNPVTYFLKKEDTEAVAAAQQAIVAAAKEEQSVIPAGYTYLGQFITHEITFDDEKNLLLSEPTPTNIRSPSLDLDSLYGAGPRDKKSQKLYQLGRHPAPVRLRIGWTQPPSPSDSSMSSSFPFEFQNDLPRQGRGDKKREAIIGDERNDENLPLAQTHVAFMRFHNRVVDDLDAGRYKDYARPAPEELFDTARAEVVRHFQWIILHDYLPKLVDEELVKSLTRSPSKWFNPESEAELFIPLEFSAAAFRIGHSMVRPSYKLNGELDQVLLSELFTHTKRSGNLDGLDRLDSRWVIDWKRFYDFTPFADEYPSPYDPPGAFNRAGKIDTTFDLHLDLIDGFRHLPTPPADNGNGEKPEQQLFNGQKALTVRNLLRGLALGLPWAEDVLDKLGKEGLLTEAQCLTRQQLRDGPQANLLDAAALGGKTPLWFYILREARVKGSGGRLGPVGGRIVAETLIGLIRRSKKEYSILRQVEGKDSEWELSDWRPAYPRKRKPTEPVKFEMVDLLRAADVVDPLGRRRFEAAPRRP